MEESKLVKSFFPEDTAGVEVPQKKLLKRTTVERKDYFDSNDLELKSFLPNFHSALCASVRSFLRIQVVAQVTALELLSGCFKASGSVCCGRRGGVRGRHERSETRLSPHD